MSRISAVISVLAVPSLLLLFAGKCPGTSNGTATDTTGTSTATSGVKIKPGEVNVGIENLQAGFTDRRFVTHAAAIPYHLEGLVGHVITVEKKDGKCPTATAEFYDSFEVSPEAYLKPDAKLQAATPNKVLYSNKVDKKAEGTLKVVAFNAKANVDLLSEVTITDVQTMSLSANTLQDNWEQAALSRFDPDRDCEVIIIRGATLSVVTSKDFRAAGGNAEFQGGVFAAGGKVYQELNNTNAQLLVAIDASRVRPKRAVPPLLAERLKHLPAATSALGVPASFGDRPVLPPAPK